MPTTYATYRPTAFDCAGLALPDRQDWIVAPVSRTRDTGALEDSNFAAALERLGGESETVEVHRFGHWACEWYELILCHPDRAADVEEIKAALENYPILDEEDWSRREHEGYTEYFNGQGYRDFIRAIRDAFNLNWQTAEAMHDIDTERLQEFYEENVPSGDYHSESYGLREDIATRNITRETLAAFLRQNRPRRQEVK